jgi:hypothetical protein
MSDSQPILGADAPSARWTSRIVFVFIWGVLHGALLPAIVLSSFFWFITAPILLPVSYALVLGWYRPPAGAWGCNVVGGGFVWMGVMEMVHADGLLAFAVFGLITGFTTLLLLSWRGWRTATWPFIHLLGTSAAAWAAPTFHGWGPSQDDFVGYIMAGALYGLITGPALAFLLHDDTPAPHATGVQDTQPSARPGGADAT